MTPYPPQSLTLSSCASCVISAIVRLYFAYSLTSGNDTHPTDDHFSYVSVNNVIWSLIEPCVSVVAACLPTFGPLLTSDLSLRSLVRSFQSRTFSFKRSTGASSSKDSTHSDRDGRWQTAPRMATQAPWSPLPDGAAMMTYRADMELGDAGKGDNEESEPPRGVTRAYGGRMAGKSSDTALVQDPGQIRVEKSFTSKSDRR